MKFIHFGCWNEFGYSHLNPDKSPLTYMLDQLNRYVNANKTDFLIIAGDNYYPPKDKDKSIPKPKVKKVSDYDEKLFFSGFDALPTIEKFLIFGNHDIDDLIKTSSITMIPGKNLNEFSNDFEKSLVANLQNDATDKCKILNLQQLYTSNNATYKVFNNVLYKQYNHTLIIMLDSHLLTLINQQDLGCYKYLFSEYLKTNPQATITDLIQHQINTILELIRSNINVNNCIFVGHHPIIICKHKNDIGKTESEEGLRSFFMNEELNQLLINKNINITYLCADLHLYQFGIVNLGPLTIKQYIVGTGGAHLDTYDFKQSYNKPCLVIDEIPGFNYQVIENYNDIYGFLVVDIQTIGSTDIITYAFNGVDVPTMDGKLNGKIKLDGGNVIHYINLI